LFYVKEEYRKTYQSRRNAYTGGLSVPGAVHRAIYKTRWVDLQKTCIFGRLLFTAIVSNRKLGDQGVFLRLHIAARCSVQGKIVIDNIPESSFAW
jgi:hypothetical protein